MVCNYPASGELGQYVEKGREKKRKEVSGEAGERQKKRVLLKVVRELEKERYGRGIVTGKQTNKPNSTRSALA